MYKLITYLLGAIIMAGAFLCINRIASRAATYMQPNVVVAIPSFNHDSLNFYVDEAYIWSNGFDGYVATEYIAITNINYLGNTVRLRLSYVGLDFFKMPFLNFVAGSSRFLTGENIVIICSNVAKSLFASTDIGQDFVNFNNDYYLVAGVVQKNGYNGLLHNIEGFAFVPQNIYDYTNIANIIYIRPTDYNLISARHYMTDAINNLNLNIEDFNIVDINLYIQSMFLRGQLLLLLGLIIFLAILQKPMYSLFLLSKTKIDWLQFAIVSTLFFSILLFFFRLLRISFWVPNFYDGNRFLVHFFNLGLFNTYNFLPSVILTLVEANYLANLAFAVGLVGFLVLLCSFFVRR